LVSQQPERGYKKYASSKQWNQPTGLVSEILQDKRDRLIENLKQKVKILAEESVTRSFINEQSGNITAFCSAVDDCLRFGLIQRKPVLFTREPPSYGLLKEVAKFLPEAKEVLKRVQELDEVESGVGGYGNAFSSSSTNHLDFARRGSLRGSGGIHRCTWIRVALFQKTLGKIADYLVHNALTYYERVSILAHPFDGQLFADLLRGPCTHEYTHIRTSDHLWTDPSAGELMQRKMIYCAGVHNEHPVHTDFQINKFESVGTPHQSKKRLRPRLSLDSGIGVPSSITSSHQQSTGGGGGGGFFLHTGTDPISPASLLYQVYSPSTSDSGGSWTNEAAGTERCAEEKFSFDGSSIDEEPQYPDNHDHHHSHASFCSEVLVQKLTQAKDYVESLHQNERAPLVYGKNNVIVQPNMSSTRISGYLSVHKSGTDKLPGLQLKWAPNRAMSMPQGGEEANKNVLARGGARSHRNADEGTKSILHESNYWDFALDIDFTTVVYIHCHRHHFDGDGGSVVLVRTDGVLYPPLIFPAFSQVTSFMQCLETHLAPGATLTPRIEDFDWDDSSDNLKDISPKSAFSDGKFEIETASSSELTSSPSSTLPTHFCFRIDTVRLPPTTKQESAFRLFASLRGSARLKTLSMENLAASDAVDKPPPPVDPPQKSPISALDAFSNTFNTMQHQILARVFYGWLTYTRSIILIRNKLHTLVYPRCIMPKPPPIDPKPLTAEFWQKVRSSGGKTAHIRELYERIYFGGCDPDLRREVWPFLLGHYPWSASPAEIEDIDRRTHLAYERSVSEWLAAEAIIIQQHRLQRHRNETEAQKATNLSSFVHPDHRPATKSRASSAHHGFIGPEKQTVEEILTDAWNRVKRRISTVTSPYSKQTGETNGHANANTNLPSANGLPPLPSKPAVKRLVLKSEAGCGGRSSVDMTDEGTEDYTLTTTDDDDAVEVATTMTLQRRLAIARAHSCPNTPRTPNAGSALIRGSMSSAITQSTDKDFEDVFEPTNFPANRSNGQVLPPARERKRSRYSRAEISGSSYSSEVLEALSVNIQRIDKDVARCDRNYHYFAKGIFGDDAKTSSDQAGGLCVASLDLSSNLYRLRTIMCTWIWQHMETGYVQGMCDLLAPLLVVLDDEALAHACFSQLMTTMLANFPLPSSSSILSSGSAAAAGVVLPHLLEPVVFERAPNHCYEFTRPMTQQQLSLRESHDAINGETSVPLTDLASIGSSRISRQFQSLRSLIEVLDPVLAEHMHLNEDNSHLYFYRWLLLDFKRELKYADVFLAWETIWTSHRLVCPDFGVFIAFAMIQYYRDIILFYCSDYTDIIRFYNERAELHDLSRLLSFARDLIYRLQSLIASSIHPKLSRRSKVHLIYN
uniref:Rab-GAP TBC domain-containing protein n=2 Tax=Mesocestoides corti TaxID=53468 RepID=A0A5K3F980_MESCO